MLDRMRVLVTGASGFIGATLCRVLAAAGHEPVAIDLRHAGPLALPAAPVAVHLAGIAHRRAAEADLRRINTDLTREVGRACAAQGTRLVYLSSVKVHGESSDTPLSERSPLAPQDAYARSKLAAEEALRSTPGLGLVTLRPTLVYGPGVRANFLALMRALRAGLPLPLAGIANRRSLLFVGNLADAISRCLSASAGTWLLSDGEAVSTPQLCERLATALGRQPRLFSFPRALLPGPLTHSMEVDDGRAAHALDGGRRRRDPRRARLAAAGRPRRGPGGDRVLVSQR
jgi:nucleoside-diphosphate-sugar epimerase